VKCQGHRSNNFENKTTSVTTHFKKLTTGNNVLIVLVIVYSSNCHILQVLQQGGPKTWHNFLYSLTSSKINWFSLIAPLVSGVAGLSASSSNKADTLNIWCNTGRNAYRHRSNFSRQCLVFVYSWSVEFFFSTIYFQNGLRCANIYTQLAGHLNLIQFSTKM